MCQTFSALPASEALASMPGCLLIGGRYRNLHRHAVLCLFVFTFVVFAISSETSPCGSDE